MKGKIIEYYHDPNDHSVSMGKHTKYGTFYAYVAPEAEDDDIANEWDGGQFAEYKCDTQAEWAKYKEYAARVRGMEHAYNVLAKSYGRTDKVVNSLERQVKIAKKQRDKQRKKAIFLKEHYPTYCQNVLKLRRAFREKQES